MVFLQVVCFFRQNLTIYLSILLYSINGDIMGKFKTKKKNKWYIVIVFIIITYFSFRLTYSILFNTLINKYIDNSKFISYLVNNSINQNLEQKNLKDVVNVNLQEPFHLLNYNFSNIIEIAEEKEEEKPTTVIEDPNPVKIEEPLIYLYNSHQLEGYYSDYLESYNITPTVMFASYILREKLNDLNLKTIVETRSVKEVLNENNWNYAYSYEASKILMQKAKEENPSLNYFIDIHRDSSKKDKTTAQIDGKSYAKILFVIGKDHENYQKNLDFATNINSKIINFNDTLSRGVYVKGGIGVNGIYNQDFNPNTILIEVGGVDNTIEEVTNSLSILSKVIFESIGENIA